MKKVLLVLSYVPLAYLVYIYAGHGIVEAFIERDEFLEIIGVLGFSSGITFFLLICTGVLDTFVAILLIAKDKIWPQLPTFYLFAWVGLWPVIPRIVEAYGGLDPEPMEAVGIFCVAVVAYLIHRFYHARLSEPQTPGNTM
jgi:hypothetical protein